MAPQSELVYEWHHAGRRVTFSWIGVVEVEPSRVYAFAFTDRGKMLLVGGNESDTDYWLPGGGTG